MAPTPAPTATMNPKARFSGTLGEEGFGGGSARLVIRASGCSVPSDALACW